LCYFQEAHKYQWHLRHQTNAQKNRGGFGWAASCAAMAAVALQESVEALRVQDKQPRCDIAITSLLQQSLRTQLVTGCASVDVEQRLPTLLSYLTSSGHCIAHPTYICLKLYYFKFLSGARADLGSRAR
jgi:hypothetical protein